MSSFVRQLSAKKPKLKKRPGFSANRRPSVEKTIIPTSQLCVNPKKVNELQAWIIGAAKKQTASILLLSGPPGSGKETAVRNIGYTVERLLINVLIVIQEKIPLHRDIINPMTSTRS